MAVAVCPAHAGMSPAPETERSAPPCLPRTRGDEPDLLNGDTE